MSVIIVRFEQAVVKPIWYNIVRLQRLAEPVQLQVLTVRGMVPSVRAIDRVERPSSASKMIRARNTSRCSVVGARTRASSTARSASVSRTSALGIIPNVES